jgi:hypothetical protein
MYGFSGSCFDVVIVGLYTFSSVFVLHKVKVCLLICFVEGDVVLMI